MKTMPQINNNVMALAPPTGQRKLNVAHNNRPQNSTYLYPPTPRDPNPDLNTPVNHPEPKPMRATINIASLNMNGFTAPSNCMSGIEK